MVASTRLGALALLAVATIAAGTFTRTADDNRAIADADSVMLADCTDVDLSEVNREDGRAAMRDYMGSDENIILKIMRMSNSTEELGRNAQEEVTPAWLIRTAGSVVFSFILLVAYFICCWSACPCCKCCLCCRKQRRTGKIVKFLLLTLLCLLLFGMFVSAMVALKGRNEIMGGMDSVSCTSARTMYHTLTGKPSQQYIGILPMLEQLGNISDSLFDNSGLVADVNRVMSQTEELDRAQTIAVQAMALLQATLELPANRPDANMVAYLDNLLTAIRPTNDQLATGISGALSTARTEVNNQLNAANRQTLRNSMDSAVAPLRDVADMVRDSLWFFIKEDFRNLKDIAVMATSAGVIAIACVIFLVAGCGCCSGLLCTFKEHSDAKERNGRNPWNKWVGRCSLTTWCSGCLYGFLVFFFGGIMIICAVPMASTCLVLDDINSQTIRDIMPALGTNVGGNEFNMVADVIDNCFARVQTSAPRSLFEIVTFEENGNRTSLKQKLRDQLVTPVNDKFAAINSQLNSSATLANNAGTNALKSQMRDFPNSVPVPAGTYRCDIFETTTLGINVDCDVKNMVKVGSTWSNSNDCIVGTNPYRMRTRAKTCSASQFVTYMNDWETRIDKAFRRVDDAVATTGTKISTELQNTVNRFITNPINNIVENAHCSFLKTEYHDFVAGFCYKGVVGFGIAARAYVANGVLSLFLIITCYVMWRISVDNRHTWNDQVKVMK